MNEQNQIEWISVKKSRPAKYGVYLVTSYDYQPDGDIVPTTRAAIFYPAKNEWYDRNALLEEVHFWAYLPAPMDAKVKLNHEPVKKRKPKNPNSNWRTGGKFLEKQEENV